MIDLKTAGRKERTYQRNPVTPSEVDANLRQKEHRASMYRESSFYTKVYPGQVEWYGDTDAFTELCGAPLVADGTSSRESIVCSHPVWCEYGV